MSPTFARRAAVGWSWQKLVVREVSARQATRRSTAAAIRSSVAVTATRT
jgi:hypothetical protein